MEETLSPEVEVQNTHGVRCPWARMKYTTSGMVSALGHHGGPLSPKLPPVLAHWFQKAIKFRNSFLQVISNKQRILIPGTCFCWAASETRIKPLKLEKMGRAVKKTFLWWNILQPLKIIVWRKTCLSMKDAKSEIPYSTFATMGQNKDKLAQKSERRMVELRVFLHLLFVFSKKDSKMFRSRNIYLEYLLTSPLLLKRRNDKISNHVRKLILLTFEKTALPMANFSNDNNNYYYISSDFTCLALF